MRPLNLVLGLAVAVVAGSAAIAQEKVVFNMSWLPQGSVVGVAVSLDRGWFKESGLDVTMIRGYGGNRTANELDQGLFDIGYVDPISIALSRSGGGRIKMIGAINTQWPAGVCYNSKLHTVKSLDDLKGLTMGGGSASIVQNVMPAWLELNGKPRDLVRMLRLDPAVVDTSLVEGKIDLAECWRASNRAVIEKLAKVAQVDIAWIEYSAFELDAYGSGFAAREETIAKKPDMLRKFLAAAYRGYDFARKNPEQAGDIMIKMFPALDRAILMEQVHDINGLIVDQSVAKNGPGFLREDRMKNGLAFISKAFDLKGGIKVEDLYTNELLVKK